jgi:hypothetical protein
MPIVVNLSLVYVYAGEPASDEALGEGGIKPISDMESHGCGSGYF